MYATGLVDLGCSRLLDVVEGRTAAAVSDWLAERDAGWLDGVEAVALDPYRGYHTALTGAVPAATVVVDRFHAVRLANQALDEIRRRVQQATTGHRGRKRDPLYRVRRLLVTGAERLTARGWQRLEAAWAAGDPRNETYVAWDIKEALRAVYAAHSLADAPLALDDFYDQVRAAELPECSRLARTVRRWEAEILAFHTPAALQRTHRSDQPAHQEDQARRPRLPQLRQLPTAPAAALRRHLARSTNRAHPKPSSTLSRVEPDNGAAHCSGRIATRVLLDLLCCIYTSPAPRLRPRRLAASRAGASLNGRGPEPTFEPARCRRPREERDEGKEAD